ncbi:MAG TPA: hypothetical protein DCE56_18190 [Cyanobacteria bacterium UBA8553]|nr:hypothetical protein [Cyanobacteria bacterium UBA8553]HAJ64229.1 hypothetical protein [Cyanobacteria bacterium UBA8543]
MLGSSAYAIADHYSFISLLDNGRAGFQNRCVLDFYSPELTLAIEIDGESHFQEGVAQYDEERQVFIKLALPC